MCPCCVSYSNKAILVQGESSALNSHKFEALDTSQLLEQAKELCLDVSDAQRKPELIEAILAVGVKMASCQNALNCASERNGCSSI